MNEELVSAEAVGELPVRRIEDHGETSFVIDFGPRATDIHTDVVGDTLIVVGPGENDQTEFDLPSSEARTFIKNGVLTIEVEE